MKHIVTTNKQDFYMGTVKKRNRLIHQHNHHQTNIISYQGCNIIYNNRNVYKGNFKHALA